MNKKEYEKPTMLVVKIQHRGMLMTSDPVVRSTSTNLGDDDFEFVGSDASYTGDAR
jgi:hypothetical protein